MSTSTQDQQWSTLPLAPEPSPTDQPDDGPAGPTPAAAVWPAPPPNPSPRWARWALAAVLAGTAALYLWGLSRNGWANSYYSAAAQAAGADWKAWFFGSLDAANAITVDKPPASLWLMGLSVRAFGLSSWAILVPQALLGVASVGVLYSTVRRWAGAQAGLIAAATLALTPVATLMFRFNNPDAMLVFLLVCAAWAMGLATERGSWRWIMLAGAFVGLAFLAKMMQAFLVLPGFVAMYAIAAPIDLRRRIGHLLAALGAVVVAAGWWVAIVELWPADSRPYIGGSQTNSVLELIFGYNGFGRLTGNETGSVVPGGGQGTAMWGETGVGRLFSDSYGGQIAWLLPAALAMIGVLLWVSRRSGRTDLTRAATVGWGGWLLVTAAVISFGAGIIHEYYTVALAPAIGALVGIGSVALWTHRAAAWARITAAGLIAGTAWWAYVLLGRSPEFLPLLAPVILVGGFASATGMLLAPAMGRALGAPVARRIAIGAGAAGLVIALAGPTAYALETSATVATGSIPSAGPTVVGARSGPGGQGGPPRGGGQPGGAGGGQVPGAGGGGQVPGAGGAQPGLRGGPPGMGPGTGGQLPGLQGGTSPGQGTGPAPSTVPGTGTGATRGIGGGAGSLLQASTPSDELIQALLADADQYTWVAAAVGANSAAGYQLGTEQPVLAIGGFNGSDPFPTLAGFQEMVSSGQIHWFIAGGVGGGPGGQEGGSQESSAISAWVTATFQAQTIGGTTVYDLSAQAPSAPTPTQEP